MTQNSTEKGLIFDIRGFSIHDGPGIRTTVFFKGCFLRCHWCHNPEGQMPKPELIFSRTRCIGCHECLKNCPKQALSQRGANIFISRKKCEICGICVQNCPSQAMDFAGREMTVREVMEAIKKDAVFYEQSKGGVTFSGGEPLFQPMFLNSVLEECEENHFHTCLDTSGYASFDVLEKISEKIDLFLYDIKIIDEKNHLKYTGVSNKLILENLARLAATGKKIIVRIPLIAGINDTDGNIDGTIEFLKSVPSIKTVSLLPYHRLGSQKYKKLNRYQPRFQAPSEEVVKGIKEKFEKSGFEIKIRD